MKIKSYIRFAIKGISEQGSFEGMLSPYGNIDGGNDIVEPGAFTKTLQEKGNKVPMLWQHRPDVPIGELILEDRADGLWAKGQLLMESTIAKEAYLFIKAGIVRGLSIGYDAIKAPVVKGVRHLKEIKLYEGSVVTFPMNEMALIAAVKKAKEDKGADFDQSLAEIQLSDAGYQMRNALSSALSQATWSNLTKEEIVSLSETIIQQFATAYMDYLPQYLDLMAEYYGDFKSWQDSRHEKKSGAEFSSANKTKIRDIADKFRGSLDELIALVEDKADDAEDGKATLSDGKAGPKPTLPNQQAAEHKSEPDSSTRQAEPLIGDILKALRS